MIYRIYGIRIARWLGVGLTFIFIAGWLLPGAIQAQNEIFIYPQKGQSPEQKAKDRSECHQWAVQQTGFDPNQSTEQPPTQTAQSGTKTAPPKGAVLGGAARGAVIGAIGGGILNDDAGEGAKAGAAMGAAAGVMKRGKARRQKRRQTQQQAEQQMAAQQQLEAELAQKQADYKRALSACLEGRGYTVK